VLGNPGIVQKIIGSLKQKLEIVMLVADAVVSEITKKFIKCSV